MNTAYTVAKYLAGTGLAVASLSAGALYYYQTSLIYPASFPEGSRTDVFTPIRFDMPYEDVQLLTPDGVTLKAYLILAKDGVDTTAQVSRTRPTVVIFHANAGNMGHRLPLAKVFWKQMGCNVFLLSYRGYGLSDGVASQKGLCIDAQTALDYVTSHPIVGKTKVVLYGQSIGGAVCVDVASRRPYVPAGIILENTFYSMSTLIPHVIPALRPFLRIPGLLTERWDTYLALAKVPATTPILFMAGSKDTLVHPSEMRALRALWEKRGGSYVWKEYAEGDHNSTWMAKGYWDDIAEFIRQL